MNTKKLTLSFLILIGLFSFASTSQATNYYIENVLDTPVQVFIEGSHFCQILPNQKVQHDFSTEQTSKMSFRIGSTEVYLTSHPSGRRGFVDYYEAGNGIYLHKECSAGLNSIFCSIKFNKSVNWYQTGYWY